MSCKHVNLTDAERQRLLTHASEFGLTVELLEDHIRIADTESEFSVQLCWDDGWVRLLNEICGRSAPWLCFRVGVSCKDTLFALPDQKLSRLAVLYSQSKSKSALG